MGKRLFAVALVVCCLVGFASTASATVWKTCTLSYAGMLGTTGVIQATDTGSGFTKRYFQLSTSATNPMLATALSALVAGKNVVIELTTQKSWDVVLSIYAAE